jgi:superfamily II DNA or RNA helicase
MAIAKRGWLTTRPGDAQVVVNVAVLTEGYDYTPTSCVVLLRPSSYKSTFIQMVGRGLRTVDPEEFPGVIKTDCIVLDFGTASLMHGSMEQEVNLDGHLHDGEAPTKDCPDCGAIVPLACMECPLCGMCGSGSRRNWACWRLRHERDRSAQALQLPLVRPVWL